jgi:hypothetical protein
MTETPAWIFQVLGGVGVIFGVGMSYQRVVDKMQNIIERINRHDADTDDLRWELRQLRKNVQRIANKLQVEILEEDNHAR